MQMWPDRTLVVYERTSTSALLPWPKRWKLSLTTARRGCYSMGGQGKDSLASRYY